MNPLSGLNHEALLGVFFFLGLGVFHLIFPGVVKAISNALYQWHLEMWQDRGGLWFDPDRPRSQSMTRTLWFYRSIGLVYIAFAVLIAYYCR